MRHFSSNNASNPVIDPFLMSILTCPLSKEPLHILPAKHAKDHDKLVSDAAGIYFNIPRNNEGTLDLRPHAAGLVKNLI